MTDQPTPAPAPPTVVQALSAVMDDVRAVGKDSTNQQQKFKFRGIDAVMNAVGPALRAHGVIIMPKVLSTTQGTIEIGNNRTLMGHVKVAVEYTVYGPAGDTLIGDVVAEAMDNGDKATAKAMSVAYRTFLIQALTLPTDEADPDDFTYERSGAGQAPAQRREPGQAEARPDRPRTNPNPLESIRAQVASFGARNSVTPETLESRYVRRFGHPVLEETSPTNLNVFYAELQQDVKIRTATRKWMAANKLTAEEAQARYQTEFGYGSAEEINPTNLEAFLKDWQDEVAKQRGQS